MTTAHTPSPWITQNDWDDPDHHPWDIWSQPDGPHSSTTRLVAEARGEADAHLIAAAPDLLDIVEALRDWFAESPTGNGPNASSLLFEDDRPFAEYIAAAIAKAEGEES